MRFFVFLFCVLSLFSFHAKKEVLVLTDIDSSDATISVLKAIEKCKNEGISKLVIPKWRYHFYSDKASDTYCVISNNDGGMKRIAFPLHQMKDFEIDAQGSEFIFHGYIIPFNLDGSENIRLTNFSIDWQIPFHSEGKVIAVDAKNSTFDVLFKEQPIPSVENGELMFSGEGWKQNVGPNLFFDTLLHATVYRVNDFKLDPWNPLLHTRYSAMPLGQNVFRIKNSISQLPQVGWIWVFKGRRELDRQSPAIRIYNSKNIELYNVNIYHAGAMGIIGERSENISMKKTNVLLAPGKGRSVSTTADATHFVNCKGMITMDSCVFENMLDDATNIHGVYLQVQSYVNDKTIGVKAMHSQQNVCLFAASGDSLRFINNETMETIKVLKLKEFKMINERYAELIFDESVMDIPLQSGVDNSLWYPSFIMRNSEVRNNRARSILLSTNKKILIEKNIFRHPMMAAISVAGDVNFWFESGNVNDLVIRNNHFIDCCSGNKKNQAVITIEPQIMKIAEQKHRFHSNIFIDSNLIETFDRPFIDAVSVKNLSITNNTLVQTQTYPALFEDKPVINLKACQSVMIEGNEYRGDRSADIKHDSLSSAIHVKENKNFMNAE